MASSWSIYRYMTADGRKTHGLCNHSCRIVSLSACLCHVHLMTLTEQCMLGLRKAFCWGAEPFFSHCLKMSGSVTSSSTAGLDDGLNPLGFSNLAEFDDEEQRLLSELQDECLCRVGLSLSLSVSLSVSLSLSLSLRCALCWSLFLCSFSFHGRSWRDLWTPRTMYLRPVFSLLKGLRLRLYGI